MAKRSFFNWSGGKDSALALYYALQNPDYKIERLLTNLSSQHRRVSMHGVCEELIEQQSKSIGVPLQKLFLSDEPSMEEYEKCMASALKGLKDEGFTDAFFGDIFLEDLKQYRETQLSQLGLRAVFPLWKKDTKELMHEFIHLGFKTIVVCIKAELLDISFSGRIIDEDFIRDLPDNVDACGENGEFHTFVFDGPIFSEPIIFKKGENVFREYKAPDQGVKGEASESSSMGFWFCDLLPVTQLNTTSFKPM